jgi:hypothetical protein
MREIKFRAWDIRERKFIEFGPLYGLQEQLNRLSMQRHADSGFYISEWTGFKDATGRDIYEGDVLEFSEQPTSTTKPFIVRETVKFIDGSFYPKPFADENSTVVGNIYENPELLTTK